jgi:multidrug transporter EmrE-like cation transporter
MIEIGLLLALGCAFASNLGLLCKHRGATRAPEVDFRRPLKSGAALFRSRWWAIGFAIATVAWCLHVAALSIAPLSMVQAVVAGGIVLLALPARLWFGISIGQRELAGLILSAAGLAFLALTADAGAHGAHGEYSSQMMISFEAAAIAVGITLVMSGTRQGHRHGALRLAAAAGLLLGVSGVAIKALAAPVLASPLALLSPWTLIAALGGIGSFYALARSLQLGAPLSVMVISSVAANAAAILGGVLVFADPVGSDPLAVVARSAAFAAVIVAAALVPTPSGPARPATR